MDADCETIAAVATGDAPAGISVVRISGAAAWQVAAQVVRCFRPPGLEAREPGTFVHGRLVDPGSGIEVDDGIVLLFRGPASFTGEDVVEIQGHGGRVATRRVLNAVLAGGARLAAPGEFTRRAFLNGRIDLTQAEAVMDLVQARSDRAARAAQVQLNGGLRTAVEACYVRAVDISAQLEVRLDFAADELPTRAGDDVGGAIGELRAEIARLLRTGRDGHWLRAGALVVIGGCPNAGKSSLLNALLGWNRAIVSAIPGTTRDTLEEELVLDGIPVRLVDTAGLRKALCQIEREGVLRAGDALAQADIIVYVVDASQPFEEQTQFLSAMSSDVLNVRMVVALNKTDLAQQVQELDVKRWVTKMGRSPSDTPVVSMSLLSGAGVCELRTALADILGAEKKDESVPTVSDRHYGELILADHMLEESGTLIAQDDTHLVIAAGQARAASEALGRITGRVYNQDLLDAIFAKFCVGK